MFKYLKLITRKDTTCKTKSIYFNSDQIIYAVKMFDRTTSNDVSFAPIMF